MTLQLAGKLSSQITQSFVRHTPPTSFVAGSSPRLNRRILSQESLVKFNPKESQRMSYPQQICRLTSLRFFSLPRALTFAILVSLVLAAGVKAQTPGNTATEQPAARVARTYPDKAPDDPFKARLIPRNSKIYIAPMVSEDPNQSQSQGFETYLAAALRKKDVPLLIVADQSQADFIIEGTADKKSAGLAKKILLGDFKKIDLRFNDGYQLKNRRGGVC